MDLGTFASGTTAIDVVQAILVTGTLGGLLAPAGVVAAKRAEVGTGADFDALVAGAEVRGRSARTGRGGHLAP